MRGVALLVETIEKITDRLNPRLEIDGILATMYDGRTLHSARGRRERGRALRRPVFHTVISRTVKFPDATLAAEPITTYASAHKGAGAYRQLARELIARGGAALSAMDTPLRSGRTAGQRPGRPRSRRGDPGGVSPGVHPPSLRGAPRRLRGPFDLLLGLIAKHKLDITEIALAKVTDEFIAHIRGRAIRGRWWDLSQASEFVLVAATLLDLKAARLLPQTGPEDEDDLALIEARDLLFARLLQYRAYKDLAHEFGERIAGRRAMQPRRSVSKPASPSSCPNWS
jgi:hypothetical protein